MLNPLGNRAIFYSLVLLFAISFAVSQWGIYNSPAATFFLLPARGWELLLGVFAAMYLQKKPGLPRDMTADLLSVTGLLLIIVPIFLYDETTPFPGAYALPPAVGTALTILFARSGTLVNQILGAKPLVWIGLVSYSAYLWHQPVFAFYKHRFGTPSFDQNALWLIALSILLAVISFWLVERPFRRSASVKQLCLSMAACFVMIAGATTAFLTIVHENYKYVPSYQWALKNASPELISYLENRDQRRECPEVIAELGLRSCHFGVADKEPSIVMWGDSLSGASLHGMHEVALEKGLAGVAFVANGCPPIVGLRNGNYAACQGATHAAVLEQIQKLRNLDTVFIIGNLSVAMTDGNVTIDGAPTSPEIVHHKIRETVSQIAQIGAKTVLIEQGPIFDRAVAEHELQRIRSDHAAPQTLTRDEQLESVMPTRGLSNVVDAYIETLDFYCNEASCPSVDAEGNLVIYDRNHVTRNYSLKLARFIFSKLDTSG